MDSDEQPKRDTDPIETGGVNQRYIRFRRVLGRGSFKTVYAAFDTVDCLEVAWNKLHVDRLTADERKKVMNEVQLLGAIQHKNIIRLYDSFTCSDPDADGVTSIAFITEQMMSGTLKEYLMKAREVKIKVIRKWCSNILAAIGYLHARRIMHRDLKLDNLFINGHVGEVKIGDLGLSAVRDADKAGSVIGTPAFMSPEIYEETYTEKVDIYAFGMCLLEMITMEIPYQECKGPAQIMKKVCNTEKPASFKRLVDCDVKDVIGACLQREPQRPSAEELHAHPLFQDWKSDDGTRTNLSLMYEQQLEQDGQEGDGLSTLLYSEPLNRDVLVVTQEADSMADTGSDPTVTVEATNFGAALHLELKWPIQGVLKSVSFAFNPGDKPEQLAADMVKEFDLDSAQVNDLTEEIQLQVKRCIERRERQQEDLARSPQVFGLQQAGGDADLATSSPVENDSVAGIVEPVVGDGPVGYGGPHEGHSEVSRSMALDHVDEDVTTPLDLPPPEKSSTSQGDHSGPAQGMPAPVASTATMSLPADSPIPPRSASVPPLSSSPTLGSTSISGDGASETQPGLAHARSLSPSLRSQSSEVPYEEPSGHQDGVALTKPALGLEMPQSEAHRPDILSPDALVPEDQPLDPQPAVHISVDSHPVRSPASGERQLDSPAAIEQQQETQQLPDSYHVAETVAVDPAPEGLTQQGEDLPGQELGPYSHPSSLPASFQDIPSGEGYRDVHLHPQRGSGDDLSLPPVENPDSYSAAVLSVDNAGTAVTAERDLPANNMKLDGLENIQETVLSENDDVLRGQGQVLPQGPGDSTGGKGGSSEHLPSSAPVLASVPGPPVQPVGSPIPVASSSQGLAPKRPASIVVVGGDKKNSLSLSREVSRPASTGDLALPVDKSVLAGAILAESGGGICSPAPPPQAPAALGSGRPAGSVLPPAKTGRPSPQQRDFSVESSHDQHHQQIQVVQHPHHRHPDRVTASAQPLAPSVGPAAGIVGTNMVARGHPSRAVNPDDRAVLRGSGTTPSQPNQPAISSSQTTLVDSGVISTGGSNSGSLVANGSTSGENESDQKWYTLCLQLMYNASRGRPGPVRQKLAQGASVTFADYDKRTPLHLAAAAGSLDTVNVLLENGADVNAQDRWGGTPFKDAMQSNHPVIVERLREAGAEENPDEATDDKPSIELLQFSAQGNLESVMDRVRSGVSVTTCDYEFRTALHLACSSGHADVVDFLLLNGADPQAKDRMGRTPVDNAVNNGHRNVLEVLKRQEADITLHSLRNAKRFPMPPLPQGYQPSQTSSQPFPSAWAQADGSPVNGNGSNGSPSSARPRSSPNPEQLENLRTTMAITHSLSMGHIGIEADEFAAGKAGSTSGTGRVDASDGQRASSQSLPPTPLESTGEDVDEEHARLLEEYEREKKRLDAEHRAKIEGLRRKKTTSSRTSMDHGGGSWAATPQSVTPMLVSGTTSPAVPIGGSSPEESKQAQNVPGPPPGMHLSETTVVHGLHGLGLDGSRPSSPVPPRVPAHASWGSIAGAPIEVKVPMFIPGQQDNASAQIHLPSTGFHQEQVLQQVSPRGHLEQGISPNSEHFGGANVGQDQTAHDAAGGIRPDGENGSSSAGMNKIVDGLVENVFQTPGPA